MINEINLPNLKEARKRYFDKNAPIVDFKYDEKIKNKFKNIKYILNTYGCQANEADSEFLKAVFSYAGMTEVKDEKDADFIMLNTCAIRHTAENRIYGELGRLLKYKKKNPNLKIAICGCMPQEPEFVSYLKKTYKNIDLVIGTHNLYLIQEYLQDIFFENKKIISVFSITGNVIENLPKNHFYKHKAFVSIMDGCNEFCTYCIVPYTRGQERSRRPKNIINEVRELIKLGYKEITLIGQNVDSYGLDFLDIKYDFANLLSDLSKLKIKRIRFMTSYPRDLTLKTIQVMKENSNIMPHVHLPMQSGSDIVLKKMNRHYSVNDYLEKIKLLKDNIKGVSITTDIIVAFPYESDLEFEKTLKVCEDVVFDGAYAFIYSKRDGTPAVNFPNDLTEEMKKIRLDKLNKLVNNLLTEKNKKYLNQTLEVLIDGISSDGSGYGYSREFKIVNIKNCPDNLVGEIVNVKIYETKTFTLYGNLIN